MPMTQDCIRKHYEGAWKAKSDAATSVEEIAYSSPVEDAVLYPAYQQLLADLKVKVDGGSVLDVGSGSGRWVRFFLERFTPELFTGVDYAKASVELLSRWFPQDAHEGTRLEFHHASIADANLDLERRYDLINIANVLFHIPEQELFASALRNLANHVKDDGRIVTTEYLPRTSMRTEWMLVRSRYDFEAAVRAAGLRIVSIRAFGVFANDPMGIDGPDGSTRGLFMRVRQQAQTLLNGVADPNGNRFVVNFLTDVENAVLSFCRERVAEIDLPSQKLVVLAKG
ncbi:MAG: class I SAM-dependent methyltransferase [Tepidisphaeraceae bacterium]